MHSNDEHPLLVTVPWRSVLVYILVSFGLAWIVALPLWIMDSTSALYPVVFSLLASAMMFTPAIAALTVVFLMRTPAEGKMRFLGFWPLRPVKRTVWFSVSMLFVPAILVAATVFLSALFGWLKLDLANFSGITENLGLQMGEIDSNLAPILIATIPLTALLNIASLAVLGEELGWRGWLLPALRPLGVWPALLLSGVIWGLWHSPVILLGYNFNRTDIWGVLLMTAGCVIWGVLFGWLRLRTGSVWPAVFAHSTLNVAAQVLLLTLPAPNQNPEMAFVNPLGVSGWIIAGVVILALLLLGQFKQEGQLQTKKQLLTKQ